MFDAVEIFFLQKILQKRQSTEEITDEVKNWTAMKKTRKLQIAWIIVFLLFNLMFLVRDKLFKVSTKNDRNQKGFKSYPTSQMVFDGLGKFWREFIGTNLNICGIIKHR